jgi:hypothetical protein
MRRLIRGHHIAVSGAFRSAIFQSEGGPFFDGAVPVRPEEDHACDPRAAGAQRLLFKGFESARSRLLAIASIFWLSLRKP